MTSCLYAIDHRESSTRLDAFLPILVHMCVTNAPVIPEVTSFFMSIPNQEREKGTSNLSEDPTPLRSPSELPSGEWLQRIYRHRASSATVPAQGERMEEGGRVDD